MLYADLVSIRESFCCEKCSSFEYDLPFQIDGVLILELAPLFVEQIETRSLNFKGTIQFNKDANTKLELKAGTRFLKLCLPKSDFQNKKIAVETKLDNWISDLLAKVGE